MEAKCECKDYLIDVPVAVNFFNRPDTFIKVFDCIKKARPSTVFLISDGPREGHDTDKDNVLKCRKIADSIDWNCKVYKFYNKKNKGLFRTYFDSMSQVFQIVDRCIFLEDDVVVSDSFFPYCQYLLDKYEFDLRVNFISGMNIMGEYNKPDGDYFFCGEGSLWGYALWKRTFDSMNLNFRNNTYAVDMTQKVAKQIKPGYEKRIAACAKDANFQGHIPHVEFYRNFLRFSQNQINILPKRNLISNIGITGDATHFSDNINKLPHISQKLFYQKTYELNFPLKDPEFVIRDLDYEERVNYVLAWNRPVLRTCRRIEALFRHLRYGDFKRIIYKGGVLLRGELHDW